MLTIIAAVARNRVIGANNQLIWHLPKDLRFFMRTTKGHTVIMGRRTYESVGKPLPNRRNIVVTTNRDYRAPGCEICHSVDDALALTRNDPDVFIVGGSRIYELTIPLADRLILTEIDEDFDGDTYFPDFDRKKWRLDERIEHRKTVKNPHDFAFCTYRRVEMTVV